MLTLLPTSLKLLVISFKFYQEPASPCVANGEETNMTKRAGADAGTLIIVKCAFLAPRHTETSSHAY